MKKGERAWICRGANWADAGGGRALELMREETNLGDTWGDANEMVICACGEMQEEMQEEMQGSSQMQTTFSPS